MKINHKEFVRAKCNIRLTPGQMLRTIRELQNISQNELSEKTGISQPNISSLEKGRDEMGRERALVLAKALRVHPAVLLFPDFEMPQEGEKEMVFEKKNLKKPPNKKKNDLASALRAVASTKKDSSKVEKKVKIVRKRTPV